VVAALATPAGSPAAPAVNMTTGELLDDAPATAAETATDRPDDVGSPGGTRP
jgi:hypothetical protein